MTYTMPEVVNSQGTYSPPQSSFSGEEDQMTIGWAIIGTGRIHQLMDPAILRFDNGAHGALHFSLNIPHGSNTMNVHGSRASLFGIDTTSQWWGGQGGEVQLKSAAATTKHQFRKTDLYQDEIEDFNRCIREDGEPLATGIDGLRAAEIAIALFESGREGKHIKIEDLRGA